MAERGVVIVFVSIITILLLVFVIIVGRGEEVDFTYIDVYNDTNLEAKKATCEKYHATAITNVDTLNDFNETCELKVPIDHNEDFFQDTVYVVFFYDGAQGTAPKTFYDDYFHTDEHEIFRVKYKTKTTDEVVYQIYLLNLPKDDLEYADIHFE